LRDIKISTLQIAIKLNLKKNITTW